MNPRVTRAIAGGLPRGDLRGRTRAGCTPPCAAFAGLTAILARIGVRGGGSTLTMLRGYT